MRVLLVEDDRRITSDVTRTLAASGYVVEAVGDGEEAWFRGDTDDLALSSSISVCQRWMAFPCSNAGVPMVGACPY
jgi:DNA-binding response OmpR family regulator